MVTHVDAHSLGSVIIVATLYFTLYKQTAIQVYLGANEFICILYGFLVPRNSPDVAGFRLATKNLWLKL